MIQKEGEKDHLSMVKLGNGINLQNNLYTCGAFQGSLRSYAHSVYSTISVVPNL